tara:strand:+ start:4962 stop:5132 length:171 start_codon:yes stop_codon:yes gene_type:complete
MTTAILSYAFSPLSGLWSALGRTVQVIGYSRAAAELTRQGYHAEAKKVMLELSKLQ